MDAEPGAFAAAQAPDEQEREDPLIETDKMALLVNELKVTRGQRDNWIKEVVHLRSQLEAAEKKQRELAIEVAATARKLERATAQRLAARPDATEAD